MNRQLKITPPNISKETMSEMNKFFMKTSWPRILDEREVKENNKTFGKQ